MSEIDQWVNDIHQGDAAETLAEMPESSVHMVMCSPPYWGLRDYGVDEQIGLEGTLEEYVQSLVQVGDEIRRVLRNDGSWWLNLGDTFSGGWGKRGKPDDHDDLHNDDVYPDDPPARHASLPEKSKQLIPHRVAIALQDAGWIVRADCIWNKPNPMPHSVKDRLIETKEYIFHLVPDQEYYFDLDAIREPHKACSIERSSREDNRHEHSRRQSVATEETLNPGEFVHPNGKNPGDVFDVTVMPFPDAHFAVYPPELCKKPIKATSPENGIVLDPFAGAGTTCFVAKKIGRRFVGIDVNAEYVAMAQKRVGVDIDEPELLLEDDQTTITGATSN